MKNIGAYEIVELLGRGAMGEVYKAIDSKMHGRFVALKVLSDQWSQSEQALVRFEREIEVAAKLNHPNIVTIHDRGVHEGRHYFVMEYIEGTDLAVVIREQKDRKIEWAIEIACQVAEALECAHGQGMIHRDIKPSNIMISRRGGMEHAKIVDFGIVHVERSDLTQTQSQPGTNRYMAPEQLNNDPVDHRSDLFSFGIVLYELFTGVHPFDAASLFLTSRKILESEPEPPKNLVPAIPASIDSLILKILEKDPAQRPQTTCEVTEALRQIRRKYQSRGVGSDPGDYQDVDQLTRPMIENLVRFARTKEAEGNTESAIAALEKAAGLAPEVERIKRKLLKMKHRVEAEKKLGAHLGQARAALAEGELDDAKRHVKDAWILSPESEDVAAVEREIERVAAGPGSARPASPAESTLDLAQAEMDRGRLDQARKIVVQAIREAPEDPAAKALLNRLMQVVEWSGDYADYRKQLLLADDALSDQDLQGARDACARARELWPEDPEWRAHDEKVQAEIKSSITARVAAAKELIQQAENGRDEVDRSLELAGQAVDALESSRNLGGDEKLISAVLQEAGRLQSDIQAEKKRREAQERAKRQRIGKLEERARESFKLAAEFEAAGPAEAQRARDAYVQSREAYSKLQKEDSGNEEAPQRLSEIETAIERSSRIIEESEARGREIDGDLRAARRILEERGKLHHAGKAELDQYLQGMDAGRRRIRRVLELDPDHAEARKLLGAYDSLAGAIQRRLDAVQRTDLRALVEVKRQRLRSADESSPTRVDEPDKPIQNDQVPDEPRLVESVEKAAATMARIRPLKRNLKDEADRIQEGLDLARGQLRAVFEIDADSAIAKDLWKETEQLAKAVQNHAEPARQRRERLDYEGRLRKAAFVAQTDPQQARALLDGLLEKCRSREWLHPLVSQVERTIGELPPPALKGQLLKIKRLIGAFPQLPLRQLLIAAGVVLLIVAGIVILKPSGNQEAGETRRAEATQRQVGRPPDQEQQERIPAQAAPDQEQPERIPAQATPDQEQPEPIPAQAAPDQEQPEPIPAQAAPDQKQPELKQQQPEELMTSDDWIGFQGIACDPKTGARTGGLTITAFHRWEKTESPPAMTDDDGTYRLSLEEAGPWSALVVRNADKAESRFPSTHLAGWMLNAESRQIQRDLCPTE